MAEYRFAELREQHGYTQADLAEIMGVSVRTIASWEYGDRRPTLDKLVALADLYDVTTDYILARTDVITTTKKEPPLSGEGMIREIITAADNGLPTTRQELHAMIEQIVQLNLKGRNQE